MNVIFRAVGFLNKARVKIELEPLRYARRKASDHSQSE
jgi:hypothetical protein